MQVPGASGMTVPLERKSQAGGHVTEDKRAPDRRACGRRRGVRPVLKKDLEKAEAGICDE